MANSETVMFNVDKEKYNEARELLFSVYKALKEKGYNPINQIVGYILSGDPTYITNHLDARSIIRKLERDEILEEILRFYLEESNDKSSEK
ncbi:IreB family regulatory phosphoprotein [Herbivorax sp. ANBcel31]|uniref:IreB family regulatory phosphoprotein n=1 Tax=Herbivorax sp. ANBcel31 TaxID=3069754 RepID=UPI0027B38EA0|nr:IreB family regulatory phosphoprotein [Herbivorax sp. ANBcel31]MDQ2087290.1 IreB family regulatory phosphoprotein [Herbivorax sp. ANBcel31]